MSARKRRALARVIEGPISEAVAANVEIAHAEPSSSGAGPTLVQDYAAEERIDAEELISLPNSGKVAEGGSHDADAREIDEDELGATDDFWRTPPDDDEALEDYA